MKKFVERTVESQENRKDRFAGSLERPGKSENFTGSSTMNPCVLVAEKKQLRF